MCFRKSVLSAKLLIAIAAVSNYFHCSVTTSRRGICTFCNRFF
jgi:hypothetical protein